MKCYDKHFHYSESEQGSWHHKCKLLAIHFNVESFPLKFQNSFLATLDSSHRLRLALFPDNHQQLLIFSCGFELLMNRIACNHPCCLQMVQFISVMALKALWKALKSSTKQFSENFLNFSTAQNAAINRRFLPSLEVKIPARSEKFSLKSSSSVSVGWNAGSWVICKSLTNYFSMHFFHFPANRFPFHQQLQQWE